MVRTPKRSRLAAAKSPLDAIHPLSRVAPDDLQKGLAEVVRLKTLTSEYSTNVTKQKKLLKQRHNINAQAFDLCVRLNGMDVSKRQSFLRDLIYYSNSLGFFSQLDMFDDLIDDLRQILTSAQDKEDREPAPGNGAEILAGLTPH